MRRLLFSVVILIAATLFSGCVVRDAIEGAFTGYSEYLDVNYDRVEVETMCFAGRARIPCKRMIHVTKGVE